MKNLIGLTLALALVLSVAPVMAEDSFEGMESLNNATMALPDSELAKVEGGQIVEVCVVCLNAAVVTQTNLAIPVQVVVLGVGVTQATNQTNTSILTQDINSGAGAL